MCLTAYSCSLFIYFLQTPEYDFFFGCVGELKHLDQVQVNTQQQL